MTRYARAHGSKASNERVPEEATSWSVMKQQLVESTCGNNKEDSCLGNSFSNDEIRNEKKGNGGSLIWEVFDSSFNSDKKASNPHTQFLKKQMNKTFDNEIAKNCCKKKKVKCNGNTFIISSVTGCKVQSKRNVFEKDLNKIVIKSKEERKTCNQLEPNTQIDLKLANGQSSFNSAKRNVESNRKTCVNTSQPVGLKEKGEKLDKKNKIRRIDRTENSVNVEVGSTKGMNYINRKFDNYEKQNHYKQDRNSVKSPFMMDIGGNTVEISHFQGFAVKKEDANRLYKLKKDMMCEGIPRREVQKSLQAERRRAEKALARVKKVVCFKCRKYGHNMSECPECEDPSGICFKCGSTEHSVYECRVVQKELFKFAHCFICQEQGHIARQCPDNPRGLYPKGGACKICGDVTHLKKDCPNMIDEKEKNTMTVKTVVSNSVEVLDEELNKREFKKNINVRRTNFVKF